MATPDRPRLRPLAGRRVEHRGQDYVAFEDPANIFPGQVLVPIEDYSRAVRHFDGETTLGEIRDRALRETDRPLPAADLNAMVATLDRAMVLDGPTFEVYRRAYAELPVRPAALAGRSYPADDKALRAMLGRFFDQPGGAGRPAPRCPEAPHALRAILCPHIDFGRGGPVYTWAYKDLVERSDADIFVILGVAHKPCRHRFALTRKDFATPLGTARTDRDFVDRVAATAGPRLFDDELAHRPEHSIEFQAVFLRYLLGDRRDFAIVPILVASFHDLMERGIDPIEDPEVRAMVEALRQAEAASGKKVAFVGGIDLCHVGPEFGDPGPVDDATLAEIGEFDRAMLDHAAAVDPSAWFGRAAADGNRRRVCGLAATYTMLHAIGPSRGKLLRYDQAVDPARTCCVTFASVAFDADPPRAEVADGA